MDIPSNIPNQTSSLFILYLIISANFLAPLFPCRIQEYLKDSMLVKHMLGYLTMTFFVVLTNQKNPLAITKLFITSLFLYVWFILTTRMNIYSFILLIILIGSAYILQLYENNLMEKELDNSKTIENIQFAKKIITISAVITTVAGVLMYYGEKKIEYGKNFEYTSFIFGKSSCRGKTPDITFADSLRGIFK